MSAAVRRFLPLLNEVARDFCSMLRAKVEKEGRGEEGRRSLTMDPSPDLFRFALEGQRSSTAVSDIVEGDCTVEVRMTSFVSRPRRADLIQT